MEYVVAAVILLVVLVVGAVGLVVPKMRRRDLPPPPTAGSTTTLERPPSVPTAPPIEDELPPLIERPAPVEAPAPPAPVVVEEPPAPVVEEPALDRPEPSAGRMVRLRARLARSQSALGRGLLAVLSRDHLEEEDWEEIEESLITADVGIEATQVIVERLRERVRILGTRTVSGVREQLVEELVAALEPGMDRSLKTAPHDGRPAVVLVVGVNGAGKTTTCGKIGRVLIADGNTVLFGAADTFRAAAADQIQTWGERVGAETVRGPEGGDPASVAFDAVKRGIDTGVDTVLIDTAGRLQNKVGLMDELGKVKRVVEKHGAVDETLLVLDATTGQNGLEQARVFTEVVDVTGVVLTKLDGTAKGGIVIAVQRKLGIPVKLVGLGEGPDDLAPFEPVAFVEALVGGDA
ncbi:signal recognition particle-docking protein FtsY [Actinoplanes sp. NEAU-A12]|uniref:Signal recognition particle receptor FtsY n=1 Tax=Actinoplanes sandaracinus TaxID=3045177 RepID=A0ABT6WD72_9ACTN|nr:signal recognition particle-docking protein FtsY [Actinoplanes sandaracinus]MDI6097658.1 signal recognition particle-docking protein FtsY [Actinoplanes sandaracinus]